MVKVVVEIAHYRYVIGFWKGNQKVSGGRFQVSGMVQVSEASRCQA